MNDEQAKKKPQKIRGRATSSKHPGVWCTTVKRRDGLIIHVARWVDPKDGKRKEASLSTYALDEDTHACTEQSRLEWMQRKSEEIGKYQEVFGPDNSITTKRQVKEAEDAAKAAAEKQLLEARAADFLTYRCAGKSFKTADQYRRSIREVLEWARDAGITRCDQIDATNIHTLKTAIMERRKKVPLRGAGKGSGRFGTSPKKLSTAALAHRVKDALAFMRYLLATGLIGLESLPGPALDSALAPPAIIKPPVNALRGPQIRKMLEAARRHDAEKDGKGRPRFYPFADFLHLLVLGGFRVSEARQLEWRDVDTRAKQIDVRPEIVKTKEARTVDLGICPSVVAMLERRRLAAAGSTYVFPMPAEKGDPPGGRPMTDTQAKAVQKRLIKGYNSGVWSFHQLRRTCVSHVLCGPRLPGMDGDIAGWAADRHGHAPSMAHDRYRKALKNLPQNARTLEEVMEVHDLFRISATTKKSKATG